MQRRFTAALDWWKLSRADSSAACVKTSAPLSVPFAARRRTALV